MSSLHDSPDSDHGSSNGDPFSPAARRRAALEALRKVAEDMHARLIHPDQIREALVKEADLRKQLGAELTESDLLTIIRRLDGLADYLPCGAYGAAALADHVARMIDAQREILVGAAFRDGFAYGAIFAEPKQTPAPPPVEQPSPEQHFDMICDVALHDPDRRAMLRRIVNDPEGE